MRRSKLESVDIHQPGLVREVMRNIDFKLNIEVADVASPPPTSRKHSSRLRPVQSDT